MNQRILFLGLVLGFHFANANSCKENILKVAKVFGIDQQQYRYLDTESGTLFKSAKDITPNEARDAFRADEYMTYRLQELDEVTDKAQKMEIELHNLSLKLSDNPQKQRALQEAFESLRAAQTRLREKYNIKGHDQDPEEVLSTSLYALREAAQRLNVKNSPQLNAAEAQFEQYLKDYAQTVLPIKAKWEALTASTATENRTAASNSKYRKLEREFLQLQERRQSLQEKQRVFLSGKKMVSNGLSVGSDRSAIIFGSYGTIQALAHQMSGKQDELTQEKERLERSIQLAKKTQVSGRSVPFLQQAIGKYAEDIKQIDAELKRLNTDGKLVLQKHLVIKTSVDGYTVYMPYAPEPRFVVMRLDRNCFPLKDDSTFASYVDSCSACKGAEKTYKAVFVQAGTRDALPAAQVEPRH